MENSSHRKVKRSLQLHRNKGETSNDVEEELDDLKTKVKNLRQELADLKSYLPELISGLMADYTGKMNPPKTEFTQHNPAWPWSDKIVFCLVRNQKPMRLKDFLSEFEKLEPDVNLTYEDFPKTLSNYLYLMVKQGRIFRVKSYRKRGGYYGLPYWANAEGELLPQFREKIL